MPSWTQLCCWNEPVEPAACDAVVSEHQAGARAGAAQTYRAAERIWSSRQYQVLTYLDLGSRFTNTPAQDVAQERGKIFEFCLVR